jgi:hypothetical protein
MLQPLGGAPLAPCPCNITQALIPNKHSSCTVYLPKTQQTRECLRVQVDETTDEPDLSLRLTEGLQEAPDTEITTKTVDDTIYNAAKRFEDLPLSPELLKVKPSRHGAAADSTAASLPVGRHLWQDASTCHAASSLDTTALHHQKWCIPQAQVHPACMLAGPAPEPSWPAAGVCLQWSITHPRPCAQETGSLLHITLSRRPMQVDQPLIQAPASCAWPVAPAAGPVHGDEV